MTMLLVSSVYVGGSHEHASAYTYVNEIEDIHVNVYLNIFPTKTYIKFYFIFQHAIFRAGKKTKKVSRVITSTTGDEIASGDVQVWEDHSISIPPDIVPTTGTESSSVQVKYTVSVSMQVRSFILYGDKIL